MFIAHKSFSILDWLVSKESKTYLDLYKKNIKKNTSSIEQESVPAGQAYGEPDDKNAWFGMSSVSSRKKMGINCHAWNRNTF